MLFEGLLNLKIKQNLQDQSSRLSLEIYTYIENQEPFLAKIAMITPEASSTNILGLRPLSSLGSIPAPLH